MRWKSSVKRYVEEQNEGVPKTRTTTVKCGLKSVLRPRFKHIIAPAISDRSIMATKITALGSLLFLFKAETAFENADVSFFGRNGHDVIKECFNGVLIQNVATTKMAPEFREYVENLPQQYQYEWPNNVGFGEYLVSLYSFQSVNLN